MPLRLSTTHTHTHTRTLHNKWRGFSASLARAERVWTGPQPPFATSQLLCLTYLFTQFALLLLNHFSSTYFCFVAYPETFSPLLSCSLLCLFATNARMYVFTYTKVFSVCVFVCVYMWTPTSKFCTADSFAVSYVSFWVFVCMYGCVAVRLSACVSAVWGFTAFVDELEDGR